MYKRNGLVLTTFYFVVIFVIRLLLDTERSGVIVFLQHILILGIAVILVVLGSNLRHIVRHNDNKVGMFLLSFIMFVALIDSVIWTFVLLTSNPGLVNILFTLTFLPLGYFFVRKSVKIEEVRKPDDIFELYDKKEDNEDIFDVYLREHQKDNDHNT